ncbi:hypothetical protein Patl1_25583 [Pistacia atlantica]|uniref:Uncharacterized protein n=1 Tax=Pistacia atlantica TaxID=434234 RepID=A0ACC1AZX9_9ROSI|nr:hypothetical protein Patl1_25583 [Pistacia atlantica]
MSSAESTLLHSSSAQYTRPSDSNVVESNATALGPIILVSSSASPNSSSSSDMHTSAVPHPSSQLIFRVVASALGTAGGIAYIGKKGNSHVGWTKVCPNYDKFFDYIISSLAMSLLASIVLVLLIFLSIFSLYKRARY